MRRLIFLKLKLMKTEFKKFLTKSSYITIVLLLLAIISHLFISKLFVPAHYFTVILFWGITLVVFAMVNKSMKSSVRTSFVNMFMAVSVAKMFLFLVYIVLYVFLIKTKNIQFLAFVLINYSVFTVFEIGYILKQQKRR